MLPCSPCGRVCSGVVYAVSLVEVTGNEVGVGVIGGSRYCGCFDRCCTKPMRRVTRKPPAARGLTICGYEERNNMAGRVEDIKKWKG